MAYSCDASKWSAKGIGARVQHSLGSEKAAPSEFAIDIELAYVKTLASKRLRSAVD